MADFTPIWPEVFTNGAFDYAQGEDGRWAAIADGHTGWGNCMSGNKPPENFGKGMACISARIGEAATPDALLKLSKAVKSPAPAKES